MVVVVVVVMMVGVGGLLLKWVSKLYSCRDARLKKRDGGVWGGRELVEGPGGDGENYSE